jgi:hypothetical protein
LNIMKAFIILAIAAMGYAAPAADPQLLQSGLPAGPLTPAWGGLVATPRGARPIALEGFSEDVNQDGFVDPIGQAVVPVAAPAYYHHAPLYTYPVVKPVEVKPVEVKVAAPVAAAPIISYAAPAFSHQYLVHQPIARHTYTVPVSTHTETVQVGTHVGTYALPHVLGAGHPWLGGLIPAAVKPAEEAVVAAE